MEATSITKWQLTESKNTTVEVSLFLLRIMIWPVSQTEGSESEVWAEKTCLLFIVACRHWESKQQETDQHEEESIAETASDDKICISWCGWTQIQTLETALGRIKTRLLGRAGEKEKTQNTPSGGKNGGSGETQKQNSFVGKTPRDQDCGRFHRERDNTGQRKKTD